MVTEVQVNHTSLRKQDRYSRMWFERIFTGQIYFVDQKAYATFRIACNSWKESYIEWAEPPQMDDYYNGEDGLIPFASHRHIPESVIGRILLEGEDDQAASVELEAWLEGQKWVLSDLIIRGYRFIRPKDLSVWVDRI